MKKILVLGLTVLITGCSLDASLQKLMKFDKNFDMLQSVKTTGLVGGSQQASGTTNGKYFVQSTIGGAMSTIKQTTVNGNYTVISSVQGTLTPR